MKIKIVYIAILAIISINSITYAKTYKAEINIDLNDPSTFRQSGTFKEYFDANDMLNVDAALAERQFMQDINSGKYELWHTAEPGWNQSSWGRWKYCNHRDIYREMAGELYQMYAQGWCKIDGDWYYFDINNENIMSVNSIIDGFQVGADGKMVKSGLEPNGMDYDTTYSYLKEVKVEEQNKAYSNDQVYIKNTLKVKKNEYVTIHKPIFAGDDNDEVSEISSQFDEMFESVIEDNFNYDDVTEKTDITVKINSISSAGIVIKILKEDKSGTKTLETLWYDRDEKNLTTYSDYWGNK